MCVCAGGVGEVSVKTMGVGQSLAEKKWLLYQLYIAQILQIIVQRHTLNATTLASKPISNVFNSFNRFFLNSNFFSTRDFGFVYG